MQLVKCEPDVQALTLSTSEDFNDSWCLPLTYSLPNYKKPLLVGMSVQITVAMIVCKTYLGCRVCS